MSGLSETEIKAAVRRRYASLATAHQPCCTPATELSAEASLNVPGEAVAALASCGSPTVHAQLQEGESVLDLGSGGGIDVFRASKLVGPRGRVIGVDSTPEMIYRARETAKKYHYENAEFRLGEIEHLPIESNSVDVVMSNCVLNLVPNKSLAFKEIFRVVKHGGRIAISDMVSIGATPKRKEINADEWAACISGAVTERDYRTLLENAGFQEIVFIEENDSTGEGCCSEGLGVKSVTWLASKQKK